MKKTSLVLLLILPTLVVGQSLSELAKKEKARREENKKRGTTVHILSEDKLYPDGRPEIDDEKEANVTAGERTSSDDEGLDLDDFEDDKDLPDFIPQDVPLPEKLRIFELLKWEYERLVQEIDQSIVENRERLRELEVEIGATSARGGAGLPIATQPGTDSVNVPLTGQESVTFVAEQNRLQRMNQQMEARKGQLKANLQEKGRLAGIPPGYLRF
jgi:hypothetical protein